MQGKIETVEISARIDQAYRAQQWVEEGIAAPETWTWRVPVQELPADLRAYIVERGFWHPSQVVYQLGRWRVDQTPPRVEWEPYATTPDADPIAELARERAEYEQAKAALRAQGEAVVEEWLSHGRQYLASLRAGEMTPAVREVIERYERTRYGSPQGVREWAEALRREGDEGLAKEFHALEAQLTEAVKAWLEQDNERKKREREEREERERAEIQRWAAQYGSEHLKAVLAAGYNGKALYLRERIAREYPGFEEAPPNLSWEKADTPSPDALAVAAKVGGTVVIVDDWGSDSVEAVIVRPPWRPSLTLIQWFEDDDE